MTTQQISNIITAEKYWEGYWDKQDKQYEIDEVLLQKNKKYINHSDKKIRDQYWDPWWELKKKKDTQILADYISTLEFTDYSFPWADPTRHSVFTAPYTYGRGCVTTLEEYIPAL